MGKKLTMVWWMICFVAHRVVPTKIRVTCVLVQGHSLIRHIHHCVASTLMKVIF